MLSKDTPGLVLLTKHVLGLAYVNIRYFKIRFCKQNMFLDLLMLTRDTSELEFINKRCSWTCLC